MSQSSPAMLTDMYELTMLDSWVNEGHADNPAVFEAFGRRLPEGRRYGVFGGLGRLIDLIEGFTFTDHEVTWLREHDVIGDRTAEYLSDFHFSGDVDAYREGEIYFPASPLLTVTSTLGQGVILETLVLSVLNHDTAIASAASRMVTAAGDRPLVEMGSRRTHEQAAVAVARSAYLAGFASSSNLAAGIEYGVPVVGTAAHAFTLAHTSEEEAFRSQIEAHGVGTTLLVDTYDIAEGIRTAIKVAGPELGAIRIDSGDLAEESHKARTLLDSLGATKTRIIVTSDLDEYVISALSDAPIDGYGVGTRVATGSGHPTAGLVYKLVAVGDSPDDPTLRPVAKKSSDKISVGGRKSATRSYEHGRILAETFTTAAEDESEEAGASNLQVPVIRDGAVVHRPTLEEIREFSARARATLPPAALRVTAGQAYLSVSPEAGTGSPESPAPGAGSSDTQSSAATEGDVMASSPQKSALLVVDVQNDFVEGGSLGVTGGRDVASRISAYLASNAEKYDAVVASRDWHDPDSTNGGHFHAEGEQPDFVNTWPVHCVGSSAGAEYAPELSQRHITDHVRKGMGEPAYSAFEGVTTDGRTLAELLRSEGIGAVDVVGIATDYCVRATALDAVREGLRVRLLGGMHAGVAPESSVAAVDEMRAAGVEVIDQ